VQVQTASEQERLDELIQSGSRRRRAPTCCVVQSVQASSWSKLVAPTAKTAETPATELSVHRAAGTNATSALAVRVGRARGLARAARHSAGCSPASVRVRLGHVGSPRPLAPGRLENAGRMKQRSVFPSKYHWVLRLERTTPSRKVAKNALRPNPSIERTSTSLAHSAHQVYVPLRGPSRFRPAHVKR
jgi:hypothetical protein